MNIRQIRSLAEILDDFNLSLIEITEGEARIRIERRQNDALPAQIGARAVPVAIEEPIQPVPPIAAGVDFKDIQDVCAPMVGVFYASPAPDAQPFVKKGARVKKGDALCIIEAMKLMNEITAQADGEIFDICVENGQIVEYGQTLFKLIRERV